MSLALGDVSLKILPCGMSEIFLPMFSSRTLMVSRLTFKSFIHLEFTFVYGVSWCLTFIFLHVAVQIPQHHLLKRLFLLHFMLLPPFWNFWVYLWTLCSVPLVYVSVLMPVPGCFDYSGLVIHFGIRYCDPSYSLILKITAAIWGHLWFHMNFWNVCSISVKYVMGTLIGVALNL